jgi:lipopolysaccharide transport system permease protein
MTPGVPLTKSSCLVRKMPDPSITVYSPGSPLRNPGKLVRDMLRDLLASRELAWRLFVRDISAMYRQSLLGYVWAFLPPVVTTLTFTFLNSQSIIIVGKTPIPYPAFVLIGTLLWQTFLDALNSPLKVVTSARAMLAKMNFPREALILSGLAEVLFNFLVRITLLVPIFVYYRLPIGSSLLLVPFGILALLLVGLTIGMLMMPLGILYNDVGRGVALIAGFWMLLTPVVYPPPKTGIGAWLVQWNPVGPLLQTSRDWLTSQPVTRLHDFLLVSGIAILVLLAGWVLYRLAMPILIERLGE